jgi:HTH-type transcriptional regulator/antitoxin HipB
MRIASARDLGLYIADRRRDVGMTQSDLASAAQVSRRWLSELERGKPTAALGLALRTLHALGLVLEAHPAEVGRHDIDLDELLRGLGGSGG